MLYLSTALNSFYVCDSYKIYLPCYKNTSNPFEKVVDKIWINTEDVWDIV